MNISTTLPYSYNSNKLKQIFTSSKSKSFNVLTSLLKILDSNSSIENYDFAGNFPDITKFLSDTSSDKSSYNETVKMLQFALSQVTMKCRELAKLSEEDKKTATIDDIIPLALDVNSSSCYQIVETCNTNNSKKSEVIIVKDKKKNYYAIKKFKINFDSAESQKNMVQYIARYSKVKHNAILPFAGYNFYFRNEGRSVCPSIITKYQRKKSLQDVLQNVGAPIVFNDTQKMILLVGIASAMRYLYKHSFPHGNLKPSNILLNSKYEPFVGDFFSQQLDGSDLTSLRYLAPEKKVTEKGDVYSFAMISYVVLTSRVPFGIEMTHQQLQSAINNGVRPEFPKFITPNMISLIEHCWKANAEERPTFKEIIGQLLASNFALQDTDLDVFAAYVNKVLPSHRPPCDKQPQVLSRSANLTLSTAFSSVDENNGTNSPIPTSEMDPKSLFQIAMKLKSSGGDSGGTGAVENIPRSMRYLKRAAEAGYSKAQVEYGKILMEGVNVLKNENEAFYFFRLAADQDDIDGYYWYGHAFYYGIGIKQNYQKAAKYLENSAQKGNRDAQYLYGLCLKEGNGVPQNIPLAIKCFTIAMENGEVSSVRHLRELGINV